ncbi:MAG: hypothetical protein KAH20_07425 [Methylococcales bacterium]|nr:hypothetical protein [Methylococcales bacterium]
MKNIVLVTALTVFSNTLLAATLFEENFEGDLTKWTGKNEGNHSGEIIKDPIGDDHVLSFKSVTGKGDIFSKVISNPSGKYTLSFWYLGQKESGSVDDNYGGFVGYNFGNPGDNNHKWLAGTKEDYPGLKAHLKDTEKWEKVTINFTAEKDIRLTLEDWVDAQGIAGDVYFDDILLTDQQETTCPTTQGTISQNLDMNIPSIMYQAPFNNQNLWVKLKYKGQQGGQHIWGLKEYGNN